MVAQVVAILRDRRSELADAISRLERQVSQHRVDLDDITATMRLFDPDVPHKTATMTAAPRKRNDWFRPGECRRLIYDVLREADRPLTTREVAGAVMVTKAMAIDDARTCELIYKAVHSSLKRANDTIKCVEVAGAAAWQVI
ncbi:hypothetical protein CCR94_08210 [Rhodoblastus sphagnicola]|uniref:Uncharacterized protein n=1 Tax=Rhodoblastus sphagnicola TaxID=333368 RepID=A0A2S6NAQ7_9HYPH|nr:hypothetical protein [Rhodoblastus sphagnicola]MBB4201160.1 hypothetical protein [Rhodoblastus sphagnicola]PPQ31712.1 hypothetical protein CCR94_08210 [Rhodoblastus sphagnicola]